MALFGGRSDDDDRDDESRSPWSSRGFVASAIVVAAVVICGIALLFIGDDSDSPGSGPSPTAEPTGAGPASPTEGPTDVPVTPDEPTSTDPTPDDPTPVDPTPTDPASNQNGPCEIVPGDQRIMSAAPASVVWKFEGGIMVPFKPTIGPGGRDGNGVFRCYAHSPIGSVFAAMNTLAQVQDESLAPVVIERRVSAGPGRSKALIDARNTLRNPTPGRAAAAVQFVGFKIVDYTPSRTVLTLAVQTDPDRIAGLAVTMRWIGGDWRLTLRSDGSISGDPDVLRSLDGYVRFRGA